MGAVRLLKLALISAAVLFSMFTALSLLFPSQVIITRTIDLHATKDSVYKIISDLTEWKYWIANRDTLPISITKNNDEDLLMMGNTKVRKTISTSTQIITQWRVGDGKEMPGNFTFIKDDGNAVTLEWQFVQKVKWYPWQKFGLLLSDKMLGSFMEKSLDN